MTHTPTPWHWVIHDHSAASLGVLPHPGLGDPLVLSISPCRSCIDRADPQEWKWGRCTTPSAEDAAFIVRAVNSHDKLVEALRAILDTETVSVHVGYDNGVGGGNFIYADAVRTDSDAFAKARAALEGLETP